jgi:hypothetical protein
MPMRRIPTKHPVRPACRCSSRMRGFVRPQNNCCCRFPAKGVSIGLDVHQATIVVAVMDSTGKLVMESILETKAANILQFFAGLRGTLSVTFEA